MRQRRVGHLLRQRSGPANRAGSGTFPSKTQYSLGMDAAAVASGDFNQDGKLDIAAVSSGGSVLVVLPNAGNDTFGKAIFNTQFRFNVGANPTGLAVASFLGDGRPDVVTANLNESDA